MSLDKFKKLSEDDNQAILEHPDGHRITVAKGVLSKKMKNQLGQLPIHFSGGGEVPPSKISSNDDVTYALHMLGLDQGTTEARLAREQAMTPKTLEEAQLGEDMQRQPASPSSVQPQQTPLPSSVSPQNPSLTNVNLAPPASQGAQPSILSAQQNQVTPLMQGIMGYRQGANKEAQGLATQGHEQEKAALEHQKAMQQEQAQFNQVLADHTAEYQALKQDYMDAHIKPNQYLENMDSGQKIGTAIGMILGGIGGAMTGQENPAMKFLNEQLNRSVRAQEVELGKKHNLLSANLHRFGNLRDALQMTQAQLMGIMSAKFKQAESKAMDPIAKGRAQQAGAQWDAQAYELIKDFSQTQALLGSKDLSKVDPALLLNYLPKSEQEHATKDLQEYEDLRQFSDHALDVFDKVAKLNTLGNRITSPYQSHKQIDALLEPLIADLSKRFAGKFTEADAKAFKSAFKSVFQSDKDVSESKQNLVKLFESKMNPFAIRFSKRGIPLPGLKKKGNYIDKGSK